MLKLMPERLNCWLHLSAPWAGGPGGDSLVERTASDWIFRVTELFLGIGVQSPALHLMQRTFVADGIQAMSGVFVEAQLETSTPLVAWWRCLELLRQVDGQRRWPTLESTTLRVRFVGPTELGSALLRRVKLALVPELLACRDKELLMATVHFVEGARLNKLVDSVTANNTLKLLIRWHGEVSGWQNSEPLPPDPPLTTTMAPVEFRELQAYKHGFYQGRRCALNQCRRLLIPAMAGTVPADVRAFVLGTMDTTPPLMAPAVSSPSPTSAPRTASAVSAMPSKSDAFADL